MHTDTTCYVYLDDAIRVHAGRAIICAIVGGTIFVCRRSRSPISAKQRLLDLEHQKKLCIHAHTDSDGRRYVFKTYCWDSLDITDKRDSGWSVGCVIFV